MQYPGDPYLDDQIRQRILAVFRRAVHLYQERHPREAQSVLRAIGEVDPRFMPAQRLVRAIEGGEAFDPSALLRDLPTASGEDVSAVEPGPAALDPPSPEGRPLRLPEKVRLALGGHLDLLGSVTGVLGAALFRPEGAPLAARTWGPVDVLAVGALANSALLDAMRATEAIGVGRGNLVQIRAPRATVLLRCYNEATDFAATVAGKVHVHFVVVLAAGGNVGLAVLTLDKLVGRIADLLR